MTAMRLMLIDDEPHVLSALRRLLRQHPPALRGEPCVVDAYTSPLAALDAAAREHTVDVIVCDYQMPELHGIETLRRLRELQPHAARILLSGARDFEVVVDAINVAQVSRIIVKPWTDVELVAAIRELVEIRRLRLENAELADQVRAQHGMLSRQDAELRRIENMWPGITRVEFADDGSVRMSDAEVLKTNFGSIPTR